MSLRTVFLTGTRADYGKLKSLMLACEKDADIELYVYITGMHLVSEYGSTYKDVVSDGYSNIFMPPDFKLSSKMDVTLANTILAFSNYIQSVKPDLIVIHGDRVEPLAGAIVGVLNNVRVAHIEGGEVTGTADEFMRHAISKLSSLHFVSNDEAKLRLIQLGEQKNTITVFGSPDVDIMLSDDLPDLEAVKAKYNIGFEKYAVFSYHPVTTSTDLEGEIARVIEAVKKSGRNYIVIYPNNDQGSGIIRRELDKLNGLSEFSCHRSIPFEDFIVLLKNADFIIGNSSAGVREACIYGIPAIDIGSRQNGRYTQSVLRNIIHADEDTEEIIEHIDHVHEHRFTSYYFGNGHSAEIFLKTIKDPGIYNIDIQKTFIDTSETQAAIRNYINEVSF